MTNPFADIVENQIEKHSTRLPFDEMCAYYSALCEGVAPVVVARASGLQQTTVTSLRAAGTFFAGQMRYPKVAAEYRALGREAFIHRYVTATIRDRLRVAADQVKRAKLAPKPAGQANPRANAYAGRQTLKDPTGNADQLVAIEFDRGARPGWIWRDMMNKDSMGRPLGEDMRGDPRREEARFASSRDAYEFCKLRFTPTEAQMDDGSWDAACNDDYFYSQKYPTNRTLRT